MNGLSYTKARFGTLTGILLVLGLAGCDETRYPQDLRYPPREDLLVKNPPATDIRTPLPGPGQLEQSIEKAAQAKVFESVSPNEVDKEDRKELNAALREIFGTPAVPSIDPIEPQRAPKQDREAAEENRKLYDNVLAAQMQTFDVSFDDIDKLFIDSDSYEKNTSDARRTLARGSALYRRHCLHCHGVSGDGRGPTGPWVHPHPRDYRQGMFKFISTNASVVSNNPRKEDLLRTLQKGIDGTSMPAFGLLPRKELEQLVAYVIHLSIRGQVEYDTIYTLVKNKSAIPDGDIKKYVYQQAALFTVQWAQASKLEPNKPPAYPYDDSDRAALEASIRRGHELFIGKGICITCHYDYGRQSAYRYDAWGTLVRPRNLTEGAYRGGRRPIDIYWRISGGILPSNMSKLPPGTTEQETWDLVNFVQHLPYPAMLPRDIREKVYPPSVTSKKSEVAQVKP